MIKKVLLWLITIVLMAYVVVATVVARQWASSDVCRGVTVTVTDSITSGFVTARELSADIDSFPARALGRRLTDIDTYNILEQLKANDKIETASIVVNTDGTIDITAVPLKPVARVFDDNLSRSYYINRQSKRMWASSRYHTDVPVISGRFDSVFPVARLMPLINYLEQHPDWDSLVTLIRVENPNNVILVPLIHGHVINLGAPDNLDDKFARLNLAYHRILPVRGWNYYDTISVKWRGQIVATKREKYLPPLPNPADADADTEEPDAATMSTDVPQ